MLEKSIVVAILAGLGILAPLPSIVAGLFLCLAGAYAALIVSPPEDRLSLVSTIIIAIQAGILVAIAHPQLLSFIPIQLAMGIAGIISRPIIKGVLSFGSGAAERAKNIKLPWEK